MTKSIRMITMVIVVIMVLNVVGCGGTATPDNNNNTVGDNNQSEVIIDETKQDAEIRFSDFLVERCVRKNLNKSWDDKITRDEVAKIKSLLIDPIYNPSIGINVGGGNSSFDFYETYIDLVDLKYLTGLETLQIDNLVDYDSIVNADSISNCKKLKKLYLQWNPTSYNYNSGVGYGYKYWGEIIAQLPELEYVDFGSYVSSHMKNIMLTKSLNKRITFCNGYNERYANRPGLNNPSVRFPNPMVTTEIGQYENTMRYEYDGSDMESGSNHGNIPVLKVNSYEELQQSISTLSDKTEDLCISLWEDCTKFDCGMLVKLKNLSTLTIFKSGVCLNYAGKDSRYKRFELKNGERLAEIPHLQVINLGACEGDLSGLQSINNLREFTLMYSNVTGLGFLKNAERLTELKLIQTFCGNFVNEISSDNGNLQNLKYYRCYEVEKDCMSAIKYMPVLQTLFLDWSEFFELSHLKGCSELENLMINCTSKEYDLSEIVALDKLKTVAVYASNVINTSEILKLPNLVSAVLPYAIRDLNSSEVKSLMQSAALSDKLSMLQIINPDYYSSEDMAKIDKQSFRVLYDKGINDGFLQRGMLWRPRGTTEMTFEELWTKIQR